MNDAYRDDLTKVLGVPEEVVIRNIKVQVREVNMLGLRAFTAACSPFLGAFNDPERLGITFVSGKPATPDAFKFFELVSEHSPAFITAAVLVTDAPREWLERLPPDDFIVIADKIVEVNSRFFAHRLAPALVQLGSSLARHLGSGLSKLLSEPGTDSRTLETTPTANLQDSVQP